AVRAQIRALLVPLGDDLDDRVDGPVHSSRNPFPDLLQVVHSVYSLATGSTDVAIVELAGSGGARIVFARWVPTAVRR
ncbi:MAG: hypothetical protein WCJ30_20365, partial [Deltaproteobacteria bacterium]